MTCYSQDLCESLRMQNNKACYSRMRSEILKLARKHLDASSPCTKQKEARKALIEELVGRWPDFFGGKDDDSSRALKRAMGYIQQNHSSVRCKDKFASKHNQSRSGSVHPRSLPKVVKKLPAIAADTSAALPLKREPSIDRGPPPNTSSQVPLAERMTRNLELYSGHIPTSSQANSSGPSVPITPAPSGSNRTVRPCVELTTYKPKPTASGAIRTTTSTPLPTRLNNTQRRVQLSHSPIETTASCSYHTSSSQAFPSQSQSSSFESTQQVSVARSRNASLQFGVNVQAIHHFLVSCLPPMEHFLHRFINAGLRTEEGLLGASRWRQELIESFLDQLPPHPDGSPVLLMEKMVLLHQFATFFL